MKRHGTTSLTGATALVTGGGRGLGRHLCLHLASLGAHVAVNDIDGTLAARTVSDVKAAGGTAEAHVFDVADEQRCTSCVASLWSSRRRIDTVVANAGVVGVGEFGDTTPASLRRVMEVNFFGQLHIAQAAYGRMREAGRGRIIFVSSVAGLVFQPLTAGYSASKHALVGLASSIFADASRHGVSVHVACPGYIDDTGIFENAECFGYDRAAITRIVRRLIPGFAKPGPAARTIISQALRNRFFIVFPLHARLFWACYRLMPETTVRLSGRLHGLLASARSPKETDHAAR
jgi:NAD(P)-dependent dehydrogenase (short-subunit alcohol dehydrogenase family)